jgi:hypothetical protein
MGTTHERGGMMDKQSIASDLRIAVEYYTELTVNEHMSGKITKEADKAWKKVEKLINQLAEA